MLFAMRAVALQPGPAANNTTAGRNSRPPTSEEPMKTSRFTEEQMVEILRETGQGAGSRCGQEAQGQRADDLNLADSASA